MASHEDEEHYDSFIGNEDFVFDLSSMAPASGSGNSSNNRFSSGASRTSRSAATTQLATDVGSVMLRSQTPFLKSVTFFDPETYFTNQLRNSKRAQEENESNGADADMNPLTGVNTEANEDDVTVQCYDPTQWDMELCPPPSTPPAKGIKQLTRQLSKSKIGKGLKLDKPPRFIVHDYSGLLEYSSIQNGDHLISINKRSIDPREISVEEARNYMDECIDKEGVLNVVTENKDGNGEIHMFDHSPFILFF